MFGTAVMLFAAGLTVVTLRHPAPATPGAIKSPPRFNRVALASMPAITAPVASPTTLPAPDAAATPADAPASAAMVWPVLGTVTSEFAEREGRPHEGIDISAPVGTPIAAARAGRVTFVGQQTGYGNIVVIDHGNRMTTAYPHQSDLATTVGTAVVAGDIIGFVGCSGSCTGPHLHFETRLNGIPHDPRQFLPPRVPPPPQANTPTE